MISKREKYCSKLVIEYRKRFGVSYGYLLGAPTPPLEEEIKMLEEALRTGVPIEQETLPLDPDIEI